MAVGITTVETVQHSTSYAFPRTCDESPGLFSYVFLQN